MDRIARTRSQHFASSPRKTASPLIAKHHIYGPGQHPPKKRRLGSTAFVFSRTSAQLSDSDSLPADVEDDLPESSSAAGRRRPNPLSAEGGEQALNRGGKTRRSRAGGKSAARGKGKERADVFGSGDGSDDVENSPRKRKRSNAVDSDEDGSWVEMSEDEEEPEFIAESDQHLIHSAPATALQRLRKAELIRLWKVTGMWDSEDEPDAEADGEEGNDGGMSKKELVDGLIAARKPLSGRLISPLPSSPSRTHLRQKSILESVPELDRSMSVTSQVHTPTSSSSVGKHRPDLDATPKALPRTRSRVRLAESTLVRSAPRRTNDRRRPGKNGFRTRSKSVGEEKGDRKARFGDEVKSPGRGLLNRHSRRSSTLSSTYVTTDTSPAESPSLSVATGPNRQANRRAVKKRAPSHLTPGRRPQTGNQFRSQAQQRVAFAAGLNLSAEDSELTELEYDDEHRGSGPPQATPLVQRLRSRAGRGSFAKELSVGLETDADDEEAEEDDVEGDADAEATEVDEDSPGPSKRLRGKGKAGATDSGLTSVSSTSTAALRRSGTSASLGRSLPDRGAKKKAIQALKGGESETEGEGMDVDMDMDEVGDGAEEEDEDEDMDGMEEDGSPARRLTRSQQLKLKPTTPTRRSRRRPSRSSPSPVSSPSVGVDQDMEVYGAADTGSETDTPDGTPAPVHTTRSGKAFGVMQSRRRRLRQEAIDDPDMEVDEDGEVDDDDETDDDEAEPDIDLSEATVSSLTRLLRDELVQMCEARGIEVGGTKPQLAKALLEWHGEQAGTPSSQGTARAPSPGAPATAVPHATTRSKSAKSKKIIHAIGSAHNASGKPTPVLLRDHIHATDPATPPLSDESRPIGSEAELNLDLAELGLEDSMIKPQHLVKLQKIGSGGFKDVYVGKCRGRKVAISEFRGHLSEMDIRELKLLAEFSHPNIVRFRGICIPEDSTQVPCMLVSELCENGDLFDYIRNVPRPSLKRVLQIMLDIAHGLEYLHTRKPSIIHRDCKSSNILINRQGQAKVGDFGLARVKNSTRSMIRSLVGTVNWQAPELWHPSPRYDYKVDVFSAGMVYWEMMSGWIGEKKYPWEGHNEHYIYDAVGTKHRRPSVAGLRKNWGAEPVNLMERMWHQDPAERPTMTDVVNDLESLLADL